MKLWLSRQANGQYMLTEKMPITAEVGLLGYTDLYVAPGDTVGVRNLCAAVLYICGVKYLKRGESVEVKLSGERA